MGAYHSCNTFSQPIAHYSLLMVKSDRVTYSSSLKGSSHSLPISPFQTLPLFLFLSISLALSGHNVSCLFAVISAGWINVLSGLFQRQLAGSFPDPWLISYSPAAEVSSLLASEPVSGQRKGKWEIRRGGFPPIHLSIRSLTGWEKSWWTMPFQSQTTFSLRPRAVARYCVCKAQWTASFCELKAF